MKLDLNLGCRQTFTHLVVPCHVIFHLQLLLRCSYHLVRVASVLKVLSGRRIPLPLHLRIVVELWLRLSLWLVKENLLLTPQGSRIREHLTVHLKRKRD